MAIDRACRKDAPVPGKHFGARSDDERGVDAVHDVGVPGLADGDDPAGAHADVGLDDAPVVEHDRAGDHQVERAFAPRRARLSHRLAHDLATTEDDLVTAARAVLFDLDEHVGVGETDAIAGRRAVERGVTGAIQLRHRQDQRPRRGTRPGSARR